MRSKSLFQLPTTRVPNRFSGIRDFSSLKLGIRNFKAKSGRDSGLKVCAEGGMPKIALGITGLLEMLDRDYGIEEPYQGPSTTTEGHILLYEYQLSCILSFRHQTGHFNQFFRRGCCSRKRGGFSNTHKQTPLVLVVIRRVSIGTNGTIGTNRKASYSNGSIGEYASH